MKSYIEFVYVFHCCISIIAVYLSSFFLNQYVSHKRVWFSIFITNIMIIFLYEYWNFVFVFILEGICMSLHTRKLSMVAMEIMIRYLSIGVMFVFFKGTIYHGIWYMPMDAYIWLMVLGIYSVFVYLLYQRFFYITKIKEYCYRVKVTFYKHHIVCYGYLDSGNFANYQGLPVIFLNDPRLLESESMDMIWIQDKAYSVVLGEVTGIHIPTQRVYIAYLGEAIQGIYPCLLNQLVERGSICGYHG